MARTHNNASEPKIFDRLTIETAPRKSKSRSFSVQLASFLIADRLWDPPTLNAARKPVWMTLIGSQAETTAFVTNFRGGAKARGGRYTVYQLPKRSEHRWSQETLQLGEFPAVVTTAYLPDLFELEPRSPVALDGQVQFVFAPPKHWVLDQARQLVSDYQDDALEAAEGALFAAFLDRRTPIPLVGDLRFRLRLYRAAREQDWLVEPEPSERVHCTWAFGKRFATIGIRSPLVCSVGQQRLTEFLAEQTALYRQEDLPHGTHREPQDSGLLPFPHAPAPQLCFDFAVA